MLQLLREAERKHPLIAKKRFGQTDKWTDNTKCIHLVRQVGSCRVTSSISQDNQAAFISKTMVWVWLDYFKGQGKPILWESTVKKNWRKSTWRTK